MLYCACACVNTNVRTNVYTYVFNMYVHIVCADGSFVTFAFFHIDRDHRVFWPCLIPYPLDWVRNVYSCLHRNPEKLQNLFFRSLGLHLYANMSARGRKNLPVHFLRRVLS